MITCPLLSGRAFLMILIIFILKKNLKQNIMNTLKECMGCDYGSIAKLIYFSDIVVDWISLDCGTQK